MSKWYPIDTAPRDWTSILIYCEVSGCMEAHWSGAWDDRRGAWLDRHNDHLDVYEVTAWMPLPEKPPRF